MSKFGTAITIIDVLRSMGIEPTNELTWSVGARVRDEYEKTLQSPPVKMLRPKTNAAGTHCFAVYPASFRSTIEKIIVAHRTEAAKQMELFK